MPTGLAAEPEEAKRFDLLMLRLQLAVLNVESAFERLRDQVKEIAGALEEKASIPMVNKELALIHDVQSDEWWQDVTAPMLEPVRKKLRLLVQFIDKTRRARVYTDIADELGAEEYVDLPGFVGAGEFERFREKARAFLRQHQNNPAVHKLRTNARLTAADLTDLEALLANSGAGSAEDIEKAKTEANGLGLVDHLTARGVVDSGLLYESPFTDLAPQGPDGIFSGSQVGKLLAALEGVKGSASI